ncbi:MAG: Holliday junction resolvase RuvX [Planctomycetota bacterium]
MRLLAIDLGDKRTGLALGDRITGVATPAGLIEIPIDQDRGRALLDALAAFIENEAGTLEAILIGLPLNMDGTEGPRAKIVRAFGARLADRLGRDVTYHDERRSSMAADDAMARTGLTHKQKKLRRDALAAAAILQSYLDGSGLDPDDEPS